jgi:hypothetical protein
LSKEKGGKVCVYLSSSACDCVHSSSSIFLPRFPLPYLLIYTHTHIYNMFGSRTSFAAVIALTLGALGVAAQTDAETAKFQACAITVSLVNPQLEYSFQYNDPGFFNATYTYDPTKCDSTTPINSIKLTRYGADADLLYQCTKPQFDTSKSSLFSECTTITL